MSIYDYAPEDPELAFGYYVEIYNRELDEAVGQDGFHRNYEACMRFLVGVTSTAKALELNILEDWSWFPYDEEEFVYKFLKFRSEVEHYLNIIRVKHGRRVGAFSVRLSKEEKHQIHDYINKIRQIIDSSTTPNEKKDDIFKILAALTLEIDRDRTRWDRLADAVRRLAGLSAEVEETGARPWLKYIWAFWGVIDKAKEDEQQRLPRPPETRRLPPPGGKSRTLDLDDEIPF